MSRRFRICITKGGRESARPSYGRSKLTLISIERQICSAVLAKIIWPLNLMLEQNPPERMFELYINNSERPVDALAVEKRDSLTDNLKSRDASASKKYSTTMSSSPAMGWLGWASLGSRREQ